jgi:very-short-patch-repair endonuclease
VYRTRHHQSLESVVTREPRAFTFSELAAAASPRAARTAIENGLVARVFRDTYVAAEHADSFAARAAAGHRWLGPSAALGGRAALFAFRVIDAAPEQIEFTVSAGTHRSCPHWLSLTCATYEYPVAWWGQVPVVMPGFALAQAFGMVDREHQSELVFGALRRGLLSVNEVRVALATMPRVTQRRRLVRLIESAAAGAESHLEHVGLTEVFNTLEFVSLLRQHVIRVGKERFRLDMYDAQTRTAIELDGARFHDGVDQRERDLRRDAALARVGILTIRLSYRDVVGRPEWCRATVREVLRSRGQP